MQISIFHPMDYHPTTGHTIEHVFDDALSCAQLADELGYQAFFVTEHHFCHYGVLPDPLAFLVKVATETHSIQVGTGILVVPFHDPRRLASSIAQTDLLTNRRLLWGLGSGFHPYELMAFGIPGQKKREQFNQFNTIIETLLNHTAQRIAPCGESEHLILNLPIANDLMKRRYVAGLGVKTPYHIGLQGMNLLFSPFESFHSPFQQVTEGIKVYKQGLSESPAPHNGGHIITSLFCHVAETDDAAKQAVGDSFDRYVSSRNQPPLPLTHPGCFYDPYVKAGLTLFGGRETVQRQLVRLQQAGVNHIMTLHQFGGIPLAVAKNSMRLFSQLVEETLTESEAAS